MPAPRPSVRFRVFVAAAPVEFCLIETLMQLRTATRCHCHCRHRRPLVNPSTVPNDPRHLIVEEFSLNFSDHAPIVFNPSDPKLLEKRIKIKEGATYRIKMKFYAQHDIVAGLKYMNFVYKMGIRGRQFFRLLLSILENSEFTVCRPTLFHRHQSTRPRRMWAALRRAPRRTSTRSRKRRHPMAGVEVAVVCSSCCIILVDVHDLDLFVLW